MLCPTFWCGNISFITSSAWPPGLLSKEAIRGQTCGTYIFFKLQALPLSGSDVYIPVKFLASVLEHLMWTSKLILPSTGSNPCAPESHCDSSQCPVKRGGLADLLQSCTTAPNKNANVGATWDTLCVQLWLEQIFFQAVQT